MKKYILFATGIIILSAINIINAGQDSVSGGYKAIPWGTSFDNFCKITGFSGRCGSFKTWGKWTGEIAVALGHPDPNEYRIDYMPDLEEAEVEDKSEQSENKTIDEFDKKYVNYYFYKKQLCMVFFEIKQNNYLSVKNTLGGKYEYVGTKNTNLEQGVNPKHEVSYLFYGNNTTKVVLIRYETSFLRSMTDQGVLYVSKKYNNSIMKEIKANKEQYKKVKEIKYKKEEKEDLKNVE